MLHVFRGANGAGQLGDGTTNDRALPPLTEVLSGSSAIAAGSDFNCVLLASNGGVRCWGNNNYGQARVV